MQYFESVFVGVALAPVDRALLRYARMLADLGRGITRFTFVHVVDPGLPAQAVDEARARVTEIVACEFGTSAPHEVEVVGGHLIDALLATIAERTPDLVLVGHRKTARGRRSLSRRLAIKAPCSVWMVPEDAPPSISGVVAAVDLSLPSAQAVSLATIIASRAGLDRCTALHVQPPSVIGLDLVEHERRERALERFLSPLDLHGVSIVRRIDEATSVAEAVGILVAAGGHDLVVVGTRGRSPAAAVLLGSESEHVLSESRVPVLVTKEPGERRGLVSALLDRAPKA